MIVSDTHGTTRDTIEETVNLDGVPIRLLDTAGLRDFGKRTGTCRNRAHRKIATTG